MEPAQPDDRSTRESNFPNTVIFKIQQSKVGIIGGACRDLFVILCYTYYFLIDTNKPNKHRVVSYPLLLVAFKEQPIGSYRINKGHFAWDRPLASTPVTSINIGRTFRAAEAVLLILVRAVDESLGEGPRSDRTRKGPATLARLRRVAEGGRCSNTRRGRSSRGSFEGVNMCEVSKRACKALVTSSFLLLLVRHLLLVASCYYW